MNNNKSLNPFSSEILARAPVNELVGIIQTQMQAEQITVMQKMIDELKDEISRLNKTPKRPKFREGGREPRDRSKKDKIANSSDKSNLTQAQ